jgi:hypothetical protein
MIETLAHFELTAKQLSENFYYRCRSFAQKDIGQNLIAVFVKMQPSINPALGATDCRRFFNRAVMITSRPRGARVIVDRKRNLFYVNPAS